MMDIKENDIEQKEMEESKDLLRLSIDLEKEKYLLKIFPSKDNVSIIMKLEKEKIETYYYYSKLDLKDLKIINKKFNFDNNIYYAFIRLKEIVQNYKCILEKEGMEMKILFKRENTEFSATFTVRKKIVAQNRLNLQLVQQIQENKSKIKILKKQITKLDKILQNKNDLIDNINTNIDKINNIVNNINNNNGNIENHYLDNFKKNIISSNIVNNTKNNKNSLSKEGENEDEDEDLIKKLYKINEKENELLKQNLSLIKENQPNKQEQENKKYITNNNKKKNKNKLKKIKLIPEEENKNQSSQEETLFCFENIDVYKNKKIYETLIIFNAITVLIIMYLLCSIYNLKSNLTFEKIKDQDLMKKLAFLSLLDDPSVDDDMGGMRENIVDFQLKHNDDDNTNNNQKFKFNFGKKKKEICLLNEEREKRYYKKHIKKRIHHRIKDINFEIKYNSKESYKYRSIYNNYKDLSEILILIKIKDGKKLGIFTNNIILNEIEQDFDTEDDNDYVGFVYNNDQIFEIELREFFENNGKYIQNIYNYLKSESLRIKNRYNNTSARLLGDVEIFEIYKVKYIRY